MSGYLQRLVQAAANPQQSVRPWTGSVYAAESYRSHAPDSSDESVARHTSLPHEDRRALNRLRDRVSELHSPYAEPRMAERVYERLLSPEAQSDAADSQAPHIAFESSAASLAEPDPTLAAEQRNPAIQGSTELLLPPQSTSTTHVGMGEFTAASASRKSAQPLNRAVAPHREPDEIQIHIGRIEVTAVPAPAQPKPKAREHDISLETYLHRRNRRSP